jgi:tetratricopeptide (TPR) repeat protein
MVVLTVVLGAAPGSALAQSVDQLWQRANAARAAQRFSEAEAIWRQVIKLDPNDAIVYNNLGNALLAQEKLDAAIAAYRKALTLPDRLTTPASAHTLAHNALGVTLQEQGKLAEAIQVFQAALKIDPSYSKAQNNLKEAQGLLERQR